MKKQSIQFATPILLFLLMISGPLQAKNVKEIKMRFEVEDGELVLNERPFYTTPSSCSRKDHPGCYEFGVNDLGKFRLTLKKGDASCKDPEDWRFKDVVLGGQGTVQDPLDKPETWGNIKHELAADFNADPGTGKVNFEQDTDDKRIRFEDQNDYAASVWYKVIVESCREDSQGNRETLEYDPRVDNRG
jgi:hypothetical protein